MCGSPIRDDVHPEHRGRTGPDAPSQEVRTALGQLRRKRSFWKQGEPWVWATGGALAFTLSLALALLLHVLYVGLGVFWPATIHQITLTDDSQLLGEIVERDHQPQRDVNRVKIKVGNREDGAPFHWVDVADVKQQTEPDDAFKLDRMTDLNYFGFLKELQIAELPQQTDDGTPQQQLTTAMAVAQSVEEAEIDPIKAQEAVIEKELNSDIEPRKIELKYEQKLLRRRLAALEGIEDPGLSDAVSVIDIKLEALEQRKNALAEKSHALVGRRTKAEAVLRTNVAVFVDSHGREKSIPLIDIVRFSCPNQMGVAAKMGHYGAKVWEMLSDDPREANQDGGLFPAIFGTVLMVFLMAITCFPLGVLAGIYLGEYAKDGPMVRLVRIAVNNLAGIPSIVYGIFGLGFFIYLCGGTLDHWLFPAWVDDGKPVFGQGCIFWASLTLGLLTIPVVIVSTEEALMAIPRDVRESSYALGSTKFQTLARVLVPMSSPGMLTGFILAMARAAGEVAPLMITGAVKVATVPLEGDFPFVQLDRQFMHLGFHIFDISCKSPNVEATKPMVYVTTLLLLAIVLGMTSTAIWLRNHMRKKFELRTI